MTIAPAWMVAIARRRRRPAPRPGNWVMGDAMADHHGHVDAVAAELNAPARQRIQQRLGRLGSVEEVDSA
jgi:hypothetical protein